MSYGKRNSMIFLVLLIILSAGGGVWYYLEKIQKIDQLMEVKKTKQEELTGARKITDTREKVEKIYEKLKQKSLIREHFIPEKENSVLIYRLLNSLASRGDSFISLNIDYLGSKSFGNFGTCSYIVYGSGDFRKLRSFIYKLENLPLLVAIKSLSMEVKEEIESETGTIKYPVQFNLTMETYYSETAGSNGVTYNSAIAYKYFSFDPFKPLIKRTLPPNKEELLELENITLVGLSGNKAFFRDKNGTLHILKKGDRIYLGVLTTVDQKNNQVVFMMNYGGIGKKRILKIDFN